MEQGAKRIELHCHSCYSERDGVSSVKSLVETSVNIGLAGMALTDHSSVAGFGDAVRYSEQFPEFKMIYGMEGYAVDDLDKDDIGNEDFIKHAPIFHVSFLIQNEKGKQNLFRLLTKGNFQYKYRQSRIPWSEIQKHREGLLVGSACSVGQLYYLLTKGAPEEELIKIAKRFDYLEIQPADSKLYLVDDKLDYNEAITYIQEYDKKIIGLGEQLGIPVVATGDVHFATKEDAQIRALLQNYIGYENDEQYELQIRSTEEMLEAFSYLGKEKAYEIVVENTHKVANQIVDFIVLPSKLGEYYPKLDDAYERLYIICLDKLYELYGKNVDQNVLDVLNWELNGLKESGSDSILLLAKELIDESGLSPYEFGYRGSLGAMLSAFLCGITCVNPLETKIPLYPEFMIGIDGIKNLDIDFNFPFEIREQVWELCSELEEVGDCFHAGIIKTLSVQSACSAVSEYEAKHGVEFTTDRREWLARCLTNVAIRNGEHPGGIVIIPESYEISEFTPLVKVTNEASAISYFDLEGFYKFDILTNDHVNMVYKLIKKTGVKVKDISLDDVDVAAMFSGRTILGTGLTDGIDAIGVPEFNTQFIIELAQEIEIDSFADVVKALSLAHGTGVWSRNAEVLLKEKFYTKDTILASREDVFDCLIALGFNREDAFAITEFVRKGKASYSHLSKWHFWKQRILDAGAPDWFVWSCEQIRYMFPRAHSYRYALDAWWCAWFKLHYPKEFYEVYFELCNQKNLIEAIKKGEKALRIYKLGYYDGVADNLYIDDEAQHPLFEGILLAEEMFARGITIEFACAK